MALKAVTKVLVCEKQSPLQAPDCTSDVPHLVNTFVIGPFGQAVCVAATVAARAASVALAVMSPETTQVGNAGKKVSRNRNT